MLFSSLTHSAKPNLCCAASWWILLPPPEPEFFSYSSPSTTIEKYDICIACIVRSSELSAWCCAGMLSQSSLGISRA
jgi:hypothetical protein